MSDDYETIGRELDREAQTERVGLPNPPVYDDKLCGCCNYYRPLEDFTSGGDTCDDCAGEP